VTYATFIFFGRCAPFRYILDDAIASGNGAGCRVVVTQPRRLAAISVAQRVASERGAGRALHVAKTKGSFYVCFVLVSDMLNCAGEPLGASVGYRVKMQAAAPRAWGGSIEFCTTGVLLRRLMHDPSLREVSHVIIDEVQAVRLVC